MKKVNGRIISVCRTQIKSAPILLIVSIYNNIIRHNNFSMSVYWI